MSRMIWRRLLENKCPHEECNGILVHDNYFHVCAQCHYCIGFRRYASLVLDLQPKKKLERPEFIKEYYRQYKIAPR